MVCAVWNGIYGGAMKNSKAILLLLASLSATAVAASPRIAVLDFELRDITSLPNTPAELARTAGFRPLLEQALTDIGGYQTVAIAAEELKQARPSAGYLFDFNDAAAQLGRAHNADWILVTRHSKPSYLFSYLMAHLVEVKTARLVASFDIEMKGNHQKVTEHGVRALAGKIHRVIENMPSE